MMLKALGVVVMLSKSVEEVDELVRELLVVLTMLLTMGLAPFRGCKGVRHGGDKVVWMFSSSW